jgi:hypothetical protein
MSGGEKACPLKMMAACWANRDGHKFSKKLTLGR